MPGVVAARTGMHGQTWPLRAYTLSGAVRSPPIRPGLPVPKSCRSPGGPAARNSDREHASAPRDPRHRRSPLN